VPGANAPSPSQPASRSPPRSPATTSQPDTPRTPPTAALASTTATPRQAPSTTGTRIDPPRRHREPAPTHAAHVAAHQSPPDTQSDTTSPEAPTPPRRWRPVAQTPRPLPPALDHHVHPRPPTRHAKAHHHRPRRPMRSPQTPARLPPLLNKTKKSTERFHTDSSHGGTSTRTASEPLTRYTPRKGSTSPIRRLLPVRPARHRRRPQGATAGGRWVLAVPRYALSVRAAPALALRWRRYAQTAALDAIPMTRAA
jgi:hypothetical protein